MQKEFFFLILCFGFSSLSFSQKPPETEAEYEKNYRRNIQKEYLFGVYIPKDLADSFVQLNRKIGSESKAKFKSMPEEIAGDKLFFSLGRWIIHNWSFYSGSRFSNYLKGLGIHHPEEMARFVIIAYHRNLNRKPLNVKDLLKTFHDKKESEKKELLKKGQILHQETRMRPRKDSLQIQN